MGDSDEEETVEQYIRRRMIELFDIQMDFEYHQRLYGVPCGPTLTMLPGRRVVVQGLTYDNIMSPLERVIKPKPLSEFIREHLFGHQAERFLNDSSNFRSL